GLMPSLWSPESLKFARNVISSEVPVKCRLELEKPNCGDEGAECLSVPITYKNGTILTVTTLLCKTN
ncbi:hypothetical protein J6590_037545, partial [Homalodisca vitripennis]